MIAHRLAEPTEADDVVQDTWIRRHRTGAPCGDDLGRVSQTVGFPSQPWPRQTAGHLTFWAATASPNPALPATSIARP
jgi:hypothetical protein